MGGVELGGAATKDNITGKAKTPTINDCNELKLNTRHLGI